MGLKANLTISNLGSGATTEYVSQYDFVITNGVANNPITFVNFSVAGNVVTLILRAAGTTALPTSSDPSPYIYSLVGTPSPSTPIPPSILPTSRFNFHAETDWGGVSCYLDPDGTFSINFDNIITPILHYEINLQTHYTIS
jgi:hypothetical protein